MCVGVTLAHVHEIGGEGHSEKVITNNVSATDLSAFSLEGNGINGDRA